MELEACLIAVALAISLWLRPWRMLSRQALEKDGPSEPSPLVTPLLATLVVLPWLWALPTLHRMPLQLQWSGACLVVLMLGWPLAIPALVAVGGIAAVLSPSLDWADAVGTIAWQGVVPATLALALGAVIRRLIGTQPFVYVLGRAFLGTAVCLFLANVLGQWSGHSLPGVEGDLSLVARWLMAWGDAFVTGMLTAIFVAFKPEWLATWSDRLYLRKPD
ncbi:hypothetical protein [Rivihabitans pingtungensis]|jgi:uncharacterized membrane protein|uniref:hypothetical protein n=1 Tax=Rivihabitans pingtungensis TaxID=1054498 RepID=UPI0023F4B49B|nr:hypothetical protein [Rivihabitans pingtungensis]HRL53637.1 hypothetical protein [Acidovorax temperans]HRM63066.1 hypothetical protein [Acidovorax temperans]